MTGQAVRVGNDFINSIKKNHVVTRDNIVL